MQTRVEVKKAIPLSAEKAWGTIRTGDRLEQWFPAITACRLDGDRRYCSMAGGGDVAETILSVDDQTRTFRYSVDEHPLPVGPVQCSISVRVTGPGCEITWVSTFDGSDEAVKMTVPMLEGLYAQGIDALAAHHAKAA